VGEPLVVVKVSDPADVGAVPALWGRENAVARTEPEPLALAIVPLVTVLRRAYCVCVVVGVEEYGLFPTTAMMQSDADPAGYETLALVVPEPKAPAPTYVTDTGASGYLDVKPRCVGHIGVRGFSQAVGGWVFAGLAAVKLHHESESWKTLHAAAMSFSASSAIAASVVT
jgi:hypothetical protein